MTTYPTPTLFALPQNRVDELPWEKFPVGAGIERKVLYTYGAITTGLLRFGPGAAELRHLHADGEHHLWVIDGELDVDGTKLRAGSYLHVPAHLVHTVTDTGKGTLAFYVYAPAG